MTERFRREVVDKVIEEAGIRDSHNDEESMLKDILAIGEAYNELATDEQLDTTSEPVIWPVVAGALTGQEYSWVEDGVIESLQKAVNSR